MNTAALAVKKIISRSLPESMDRDALRKAHEHAEEFHAGMAEALIAEDELSETDENLIDRPYWQQRYQDGLGKAAAAAAKMPAVWLAILDVKIETVPATVPAAAE